MPAAMLQVFHEVFPVLCKAKGGGPQHPVQNYPIEFVTVPEQRTGGCHKDKGYNNLTGFFEWNNRQEFQEVLMPDNIDQIRKESSHTAIAMMPNAKAPM